MRQGKRGIIGGGPGTLPALYRLFRAYRVPFMVVNPGKYLDRLKKHGGQEREGR